MHSIRQRLRYMIEQGGYYPFDVANVKRDTRKLWYAIVILAALHFLDLAVRFL